MQNIAINPPLRADFDNTPNEERSQTEIDDWWDQPFIVTCTWEEHQTDQNYNDFKTRLKSYGLARLTIQPREEWEKDRENWKLDWYKAYPSGMRFEVRCLDGGAWDRATSWGFFRTLEEAMQCASRE